MLNNPRRWYATDVSITCSTDGELVKTIHTRKFTQFYRLCAMHELVRRRFQ